MDEINLNTVRALYTCYLDKDEKILDYTLDQLNGMDADGNGLIAFNEYLQFERPSHPGFSNNYFRTQFNKLDHEVHSIFLTMDITDSQKICKLEAGPLTLDIHISKTAHLFHVVDQLSGWDEFCHKQYGRYFEKVGDGLNEEDQKFLDRHKAIRKKYGWNCGLEKIFYTPHDLDSALKSAVKNGLLTKDSALKSAAEEEREILLHFKERIESVMAQEMATLNQFAEGVFAKQSVLAKIGEELSRFVGGAELNIPVYLIANPQIPNSTSYGGGYNDGVLTLEVVLEEGAYFTLVHECFHAFLRAKDEEIEKAVDSVEGLTAQTLREGLAYAYSPGIYHEEASDRLLLEAKSDIKNGKTLSDSYLSSRLYGIALRPFLREALAKGQTLEEFLPTAVGIWAKVPGLYRIIKGAIHK